MFRISFNSSLGQRPARTGRLASTALAAFFAVASVASAANANILSNSEFSNFTTSPWIASQGTLLLSNLDRQNNPDSGSARLAHPASFIGSSLLSECKQIQGGAAADVGGYFRTAASNGSGSKMRIGRFYYSDTSCQTFLSSANSGYLVAPSNWTGVTNSGTAPANAKSVRMEIVAASSTGNEAFDLLADGLFLNSSGSTLPGTIFKNGFESGNTTGWSTVR